ncbi:MAG: hypothetical protein ACXABY_09730, partial [Candidatus Thorarchaeota archaeon]
MGNFWSAVSTAASGGGGGASGLVGFYADMETQHKEWLDDIDTIIDAALLAASPYNGASAYDPATPIATMETQMTALATAVAKADVDSTWEAYVDRALVKADEVLFDETTLSDAREAFNNRTEDEFISGVNSLSTWAGGVGAVDGSAFAIGLALVEMDRARRVDDFDANLHFELYKLRAQYMIQGT